MSSSERNAWIRLASILIVFVPYFSHVLRLFQKDEPYGRAICIAFLVAAIVHGVLNGIGQTVAALAFGRVKRDERDRVIDGLSLRIAYFTLITAILGALSTIAFLGVLTPPTASGRILLPTFSVTSQFVFFSFVGAEVLRHATQLFCYRRAA